MPGAACLYPSSIAGLTRLHGAGRLSHSLPCLAAYLSCLPEGLPELRVLLLQAQFKLLTVGLHLHANISVSPPAGSAVLGTDTQPHVRDAPAAHAGSPTGGECHTDTQGMLPVPWTPYVQQPH